MTYVVIDFETRSLADLKKVGAARYAEDFSTEILCACFRKPDGQQHVWYPWEAATSTGLTDLVWDEQTIFVSHGNFERVIWRTIMVPQFGFPDIPNERWEDTMAVCGMLTLPLDLDGALAIANLGVKDKEGSKLTISLSKLKKGNLPAISPETRARVVTYCHSDVDNEVALLKYVGRLQDRERPIWELDQKINERGVRLDLDYIDACQKIVDEYGGILGAEFAEITGGLGVNQVAKIRDWCDTQGLFIPDLQKETLNATLGTLGLEDDEPDDDFDSAGRGGDVSPHVPQHVQRALDIRRLVGSASIKKLARMRAAVCSDGRARYLLQYHAARTGRWGGRIIQPQNFPRPFIKLGDKPFPREPLVDALSTGDWQYVNTVVGPPIHAVVSGLRHSLIAARGKKFVSGDYASIEARIVLAIAGQRDKCDFLKRGGNAYCDVASQIFGRPIDKKADPYEYQMGKNTVLGLGFQMGWRKFWSRYCSNQPKEFAQKVVEVYRRDWAPKVPEVWKGLEEAALRAVWSGGTHEAFGVAYFVDDEWLVARLPSGRNIYYYQPRPHMKTMSWSTPEKPDIRPSWSYLGTKNGVTDEIDAFGGQLTEHVVSGLARDLLCHSALLLDANGFPIVLTVHDENLSEASTDDEVSYKQIMEDMPAWAVALNIPVEIETWSGERYRK